jgi:pimeloyl-ACP methyl ester carboxylesterase
VPVQTKIGRRELLAGGAGALALASAPGRALAGGADPFIVPFTYRASDEALADLRRRLEQTRWSESETGVGWEQGPPLTKVQELIAYWRTQYDWRRCEAELNGWPQFKTTIDGLGIHFIHVRSRHPDALPIILTHGWPSTVMLFRDVIGPLIDPTGYNGTAGDAFDVVIPSLPGFAFSDKPATGGWNAVRTARAWGVLMQRLGYSRYVAQGGDWGAFVTTAMAQQQAPGLAAIHLNFAQTMPDEIPTDLLPDQRRVVEAVQAWREKGGAYLHLHKTRPQLVGYVLADSPMAQAAWIYDIFNAGTGNTGDPEAVLSRDKMLDEITLYWLTNSAASSARFYLEQDAILDKRNNPGRVDLPVGVSVFPHDLPAARSWAHAVYPRLFYWNELDRGGHFASLEVPGLFTEELRRCFRAMRKA